MNSILIAIGLNRRSMMKFFLFLFATACLVAAVSGRTVDYERVMRLNKEKTDYAQDLLFILQNALADSTGTCKTCWKYFGVISKHMRMYSKIPPTDNTVRILCQALRIYDVDGDCSAFLKTAYMNLTNYMSIQVDPSRICPTALNCKPTEQDKTMVAFDSFNEEGFGWCGVCKIWAKLVVNVIEKYAKEGTDKLRDELLMYCKKAGLAPLRRMCQAGVEALIDHIPQILKGGADEVCKLLKAC